MKICLREKPAQTSVQKPRSLFVGLIGEFFSCVGTVLWNWNSCLRFILQVNKYLNIFLVNNLYLKGQCHEIFCFWFFSLISFPPAPEYCIKTVSNFFENSRRYSQLKVCHRCRWHRWQMEKIFNQKNFNNFVWSPLGSRGNIYINFCLQNHF